MLFAGKGAGSLPTAAAVLSDVIELTERRRLDGWAAGVAPAWRRDAADPAGVDAGAPLNLT
jgi:hypothetical protein